MRRVLLTSGLHEMLTRSITGRGGQQNLARYLKNQIHREIDGKYYILVDEIVMNRVRRYAWKYGNGGWQVRWRVLIAEHDRLFPARQALAA